MLKKYLKINKTAIAGATLFVAGLAFFVFYDSKQDVIDNPCQFKYLPMLVGHNTRGIITTQEQQEECSLKELQSAQVIKITESKIGDIQLSVIKNYIKTSFTDNECSRYSSNPEIQGCLIEIDLKLKEIIRGLITTLNNHWGTKDTIVNNNIVDIEQVKTDWGEWYVSENYTDNLKAKTCTIESVQQWGASVNANGLRFSECIIKYDAVEILWLLERFKDIDMIDKEYTN